MHQSLKFCGKQNLKLQAEVKIKLDFKIFHVFTFIVNFYFFIQLQVIVQSCLVSFDSNVQVFLQHFSILGQVVTMLMFIYRYLNFLLSFAILAHSLLASQVSAKKIMCNLIEDSYYIKKLFLSCFQDSLFLALDSLIKMCLSQCVFL